MDNLHEEPARASCHHPGGDTVYRSAWAPAAAPDKHCWGPCCWLPLNQSAAVIFPQQFSQFHIHLSGHPPRLALIYWFPISRLAESWPMGFGVVHNSCAEYEAHRNLLMMYTMQKLF